MIDNQKTKEVLSLYSELMKQKNRNLREQTYVGIVEVFIRNGNLNHASYFLCQMDRLKISIPRKLLDMFLDYSINHHFFEKEKEEVVFENKGFNRKQPQSSTPTNKFDSYNPSAPEFDYYFKSKNRYQSRIDDLNKVYKKLRLDAKPYVPKRIAEDEKEANPLKNVDISKTKDYVPKNTKKESEIKEE